jgi:hypothetical protein
MTSKQKIIGLAGILVAMPLMHSALAAGDHMPNFDVRVSCKAAETYDVMEDKAKTYKGCMDDENRARGLMSKNWSHFKAKDRIDCVTQGELVAPSYVEMLTCLEMSDDTGALLSKDVNQPTGTPDSAPVAQPALPKMSPK